jgi:large subunit ribosomal protein L3
MINGLWGKKLGMTEVFHGDLALPVTVLDASGWYVLQIKTVEADSYLAIKVGCLKARYKKEGFKAEYLKKLDNYFDHVKEIKVKQAIENLEVGSEVDFSLAAFVSGEEVDVIGTTKGAGFTGVVKRHNFGGGRASHGGSNTLRAPGSVSFMRSQGKVIKGKRMAGHMGVERKTIKKLELVRVDSEAKIILVKGAVPGKSGSLVFVRKYK